MNGELNSTFEVEQDQKVKNVAVSVKTNNEENSYSYPSQDSTLGNFLGSIADIVSKAAKGTTSDRESAQLMLENSWITLIGENLKNDNYFVHKHQSLLLKSLNSVFISIFYRNKNRNQRNFR